MGRTRKREMGLNALAEALGDLIPEDWELVVTFTPGELGIEMFNPEGDRIKEWPDDLTTEEIALWYVNRARKAEGLPPGKVPGLWSENERGGFEQAT